MLSRRHHVFTFAKLRLGICGGLALACLHTAVGQETRVAPPPAALPSIPPAGNVPVASSTPRIASNGANPSPANNAPTSNNQVPSLETRPASPTSVNPQGSLPTSSTAPSNRLAPVRSSNVALSNSAGQYWMEYDIRPYTQQLKNVERPQQAIIDWILRDTGTDVWFSESTGVLTADRSTLRVYHNDGMHQMIKQVYERFVNGPIEPQVFSLRIITIANPNWRQRALAWMRSVEVDSPGVHGWLLNKEHNALLMSTLRSRSDVRETPLPELTLLNGQSHNIDQLRSRNYVREYTRQEQPYPAYVPVNDEIQEGYRLQFSPLMSTDLRAMDIALKCSIDQVEKLNPVGIDLPTTGGGIQNAQISVPQLVSWRLNERFRWPTDQVLVLSCGVIAAPTANTDGALLNGGLLGLNRLLPNMAGSRADALLVVEYKGNAATQLPTGQSNGNSVAGNATNSISRGRY